MKNIKPTRHNRGFSLVEVLTAIAIIGFTVAVAIPNTAVNDPNVDTITAIQNNHPGLTATENILATPNVTNLEPQNGAALNPQPTTNVVNASINAGSNTNEIATNGTIATALNSPNTANNPGNPATPTAGTANTGPNANIAAVNGINGTQQVNVGTNADRKEGSIPI